MLITILLLVLFFIGINLFEKIPYKHSDTLFGVNCLISVLAVCSFMFLMINYIKSSETAAVAKGYQHTLKSSRGTTQYERALSLREIAEINADITTYQYWNNTWIGDGYINDNIDDAQLLNF